MSYEVTATKYRPQNFDELSGQEFVAATLKNSIEQNHIANAFLLSGPRGVGKTSTARIVAKALNCVEGPTGTPCNKCDNCISITGGNNTDVIEIDGASNTSINDIRIIQEEILYPPTNSKFKIYIIDEVHMLSTSAFNALLKTIEEPPEQVVFIFATTEIHKVLPTIRSRCQQFNFRLIPSEVISNSLKKVLTEKQIAYEDSAITWIANEGKGSMRDAYTLLDQVISFCKEKITLSQIRDKLGLIGEERINQLIKSIINNDHKEVMSEYLSYLETGISPEQIITEIIKYFRNLLLIKSQLSSSKIIGFDPALYQQEIIDSFSFEDIENIMEILFLTYNNSRQSVDLNTEIEICLLRLLQYKDFIRPRKIIYELQLLKKELLSPNIQDIDNIEKKKITTLEVNENNKKNLNDHHVNPDKSEILSFIQNKISPSDSIFHQALDKISIININGKIIEFHINEEMYYNILVSHIELLNNLIKTILGDKHEIEIINDNNTQKANDITPHSIINENNLKSVFNISEEL